MGNFNDLHQIEGLQFIPVNDKKMPIVKNWQTSREKHDLSNCYGVGLVCGEPSGMLEALDFDLKYDISGNLFDQYKRIVMDYAPELLKKMVVQKTKNGGYHMLYRCQKIEGNLKLANRPTTAEEKAETYRQTYEAESLKGKSDDEAKKAAEKASNNDKVRVLIESRGLGGQVVCAPTSGYNFVYGDLCSITEINPDERDTLLNIARQFNSYHEEFKPIKPVTKKQQAGLSPFEDYNDRGDVVALLEQHGWQAVGRKGNKVLLKRPGQTSAAHSGNFDYDRKWFSVFTTSTEFEPQKAYQAYAVFAVLECNKDFVEASRRLYEMGYGDRHEEKKTEKQSTRAIPSRISTDDDDLSFLAKPEDYEGYLQQVIDGTLPQGLTTGMPELDKYFLFKKGNLVMVNGIDNVGKSKVVWYLALISAMLHGWKWIVFSSENTLGNFMRTMIQYYWGKPLNGPNAMNEMHYKAAKAFIEQHFLLIKAQEDLFNYKDIINMVKKARKAYPEICCGLIDPYNSLKIDLSGFSKLNTHEYHYEALSELKAFGQQNSFGWYVIHHAVTASARAKDSENKYPIAPQKADTEGGQKVANKADDFITIHRITQHPTEWMVTEFHVRKIKETETGGKVTPKDYPVKLKQYAHGCAFIEHYEGFGEGVDPIQYWHRMKENIEIELPLPKPPILIEQPVRITPKPLQTKNDYEEVDEDWGDVPFG